MLFLKGLVLIKMQPKVGYDTPVSAYNPLVNQNSAYD
jgi:hypothetical protein